MRTCLRAAALIFATSIGAWSLPARAQDINAVAGTYCLTGVMEVGSCIKLAPGGKFEYFLAYGAYDENSEGTWKLDGGHVVLDSLRYDKRPTFTFKRMQPSESGAFDVIVESKTGRAIPGIDVSVTCDGATHRAGVTSAEGFKVACASAPTQVLLGVRMYGVALQTLDVAAQAGADKTYVFTFDPGDLGRKSFTGLRLPHDGGSSLVMTYADTPIRELSGRPFKYVRP